MRRTALLWAGVGLLSLGGAGLVVADDPAPAAPAPAPQSAEATRIARLVEDLGAADFRIREAATQALIELGPKARTALEQAAKSDSPAVRFRADQILQRLGGDATEKPLDDGTPAQKPGARGDPSPLGPRFFSDGDFEKLRQDMERRFAEIQRELEKEGLGAMNGLPGGWQDLFAGARARRATDLRVKVDGGDVWAELWEGPHGAKIQFTEKAEPANVTTFSGKTIAAILEGNPKLKDWPGAGELLQKYEVEKKARAEKLAADEAARAERQKAWRARAGLGMPGAASGLGRSIVTEMTDGHVKVTVTETDESGKTTTKTYEGTDMESLRRDNPELKDVLGGVQIHIGRGGGSTLRVEPVPMPKGPKPLGEADDGDDDGPDVQKAAPETGPFGLGLTPVHDLLRGHLGLEAGKGALVVAVREGSDAAKLGLQLNDVITAVNGAAVASLDTVGAALRGLAADAPLVVDVIRAGKPLQLKR